MGWATWKKSEDAILIDMYCNSTWDEISECLPGRSILAIKGRGRKLGLRRIAKDGNYISDDYCLVDVGGGMLAIVDIDDYVWLDKLNWSARGNKSNNVYAHASIKTPDGHSVNVSMHRLIMNAPDHIMIDHINGNGLDNRKANLRLCYNSQNLMNQKQGRGASKYKGVHPRAYKNTIRWQAYINFEKKQSHLGFFNTEEDAAKAYDRQAKILFGEFANLNFPE